MKSEEKISIEDMKNHLLKSNHIEVDEHDLSLIDEGDIINIYNETLKGNHIEFAVDFILSCQVYSLNIDGARNYFWGEVRDSGQLLDVKSIKRDLSKWQVI